MIERFDDNREVVIEWFSFREKNVGNIFLGEKSEMFIEM